MAFTVSDFNDLVQLLAEHPQWRVELRRLLLSEDFEALPKIVRELVEAQRLTEQRLNELAEAQRLTGQRMNELAEAQRLTEQRMAELAEAQRLTEVRMAGFEEKQERMQRDIELLRNKVGQIDGRTLELDYREKTPAIFGRWLDRARAVRRDQLWDLLEGHLDREERQDAMLADVVVQGRLDVDGGRSDIYLTVEVSAVVDGSDVARAVRRAELFRRAGVSALPVVAGHEATGDAEAAARERSVFLVRNGSGMFWEETLARWLPH